MLLGDSIAVGVSWMMPECEHRAKVGIAAGAFLTRFGCKGAERTIISLGSNPGQEDEASLRKLRACQTGQVIWMLPPARLREFIRRLAAENHDQIVDVRDGGAGPGHIHPNRDGYNLIADAVRSQFD